MNPDVAHAIRAIAGRGIDTWMRGRFREELYVGHRENMHIGVAWMQQR